MTAVVETGTFIDEAAIDEALQAASTKDAGARARDPRQGARAQGPRAGRGRRADRGQRPGAARPSCSRRRATSRTRSTASAWCSSRRSTSRNLCGNECLYCAFRARNTELKRRALTQEEIRREVEAPDRPGAQARAARGRRVLPQARASSYVLKCIETIYAVKRGNGEIRRVNVNVAPLDGRGVPASSRRPASAPTSSSRRPTTARPTPRVHLGGKKKDYDWRVTGMDRAMEAGIDDVGIGVLFGLFDWRFEMLALHAAHPRTSSALRRRPAHDQRAAPGAGHAARTWPATRRSRCRTSTSARSSPSCAWPCPTPASSCPRARRPTSGARRSRWACRRSRAGSRTNPGGYAEDERVDAAQFQLGDHRSLDEVIRDVAELGYIPSFCTACYRLGRTGKDFMDLAKPGEIKQHCDPNAPVHLRGVPARLRHRRDPRGRRGAASSADRGDGPGAPRAHREDARPGAARGNRDVLC